MKNTVQLHEEDPDASTSLSRLPDEIILQVLNKLFDLKTLCFCYLVSKRFSSIVLQVDAISFTAPLLIANIPDNNNVVDVDDDRFPKKLSMLFIKPLQSLRGMTVAMDKPLPPAISSFHSESFRSVSTFLSKFTSVKSVSIELASTSLGASENRLLFKWKVKLGKGIESFIFLSPYSISDTDGFSRIGGREEDTGLHGDLFMQKATIAFQCLRDVIMWYKMLLYIAMRSPKLEEVSITDSRRRERVSLNGEKLCEVKEWLLCSASETVNLETKRIEVPISASQGYIPVLKLPISGCVMKGVAVIVMVRNDLWGGTESADVLMNSNDSFEDKEEAIYNEAVMGIMDKRKAMMQMSL